MLTDTKIRNLKPTDKLYKMPDRDGLYVAVMPTGTVSFRYNYVINGRQETLTIGRYGVGGITLAEARDKLSDAKKMIASGKSPAQEKARDKSKNQGQRILEFGRLNGSRATRWQTPQEICGLPLMSVS